MRERFINREFKESSLQIIQQANAIIDRYQAMGYKLTLRQLYYQFVSKDLIANQQSEYKRLGSIINDGRLAGLIDWTAIEDRTRNVKTPIHWRDPKQILEAVSEQYRENLWADQDYHVEVWIEKDALIGVIEAVCERFRVHYFACRGYTSQSEAYEAGLRMKAARKLGRTPIVFHLGDHDPSGIDMTRDNQQRLEMFSRGDVEVRRLALNMDQVDQYDPPPNPAKETDSRALPYIEQFGESSWELDALDPPVIEQLISDAIDGIIDKSSWDMARGREERAKVHLDQVQERWEDVVDFLDAGDDEEEE